MNKGFSLLEFLVASTLFVGLLLGGYALLQQELHLHERIVRRTRPEAELNYRMLIVRTFLEGATRGIAGDPILSRAPVVFPDLQFGSQPEEQAFSVAIPVGKPSRFVNESERIRISGVSPIKPGTLILLAGAGAAGEWDWDYRRIESATESGSDQYLRGSSLANRELPRLGSWIVVEMQGLAFRNGTLYWVQPSGQLSPFTSLDHFQCRRTGEAQTVNWRSGKLQFEFEVMP